MSELIHEEITIDDMEYISDQDLYQYICPCGDFFSATTQDFIECGGIAMLECPSCPLKIRVSYDPSRFSKPSGINVLQTEEIKA